MGITFGDYLIDSGYYDPEEASMQDDFDKKMELAEKRGYFCESLSLAHQSIVSASIGSCDCNTKTNNPAYHLAYCRWLKLIDALDRLEGVAEYLRTSVVERTR